MSEVGTVPNSKLRDDSSVPIDLGAFVLSAVLYLGFELRSNLLGLTRREDLTL